MPENRDSELPVILVVDEETQIRTAICEHLAQNGFTAVDAETSDGALDCLRRRSDVRGAVVDAHLPGSVDGSGLVHLLRREWPDLAVVMVSGHSDHTSGALPEGSEFLNKPNLSEQLVPMLRRLLGNSGSN